MEQPRNIYEHLHAMRPRLVMYLGNTSILNLEHYVHGYQGALGVHGIAEAGVPSFELFLGWLVLTQEEGGWRGGWASGLLDRCNDNDEALDRFFELAAEFGRHEVVEGPVLDLPPNHQRSRQCRQFNGNRPMPTRLQLMHLCPGDACFLRSWYGALPRDDRWPKASSEEVLERVEWEYDLPKTAWGLPTEGR